MRGEGPTEPKSEAGELPVVFETPQRELHEMKQPLNLIRLTAANIRSRIVPELDEACAAYLAGKLDRIEAQIERAVEIAERVLRTEERGE